MLASQTVLVVQVLIYMVHKKEINRLPLNNQILTEYCCFQGRCYFLLFGCFQCLCFLDCVLCMWLCLQTPDSVSDSSCSVRELALSISGHHHTPSPPPTHLTPLTLHTQCVRHVTSEALNDRQQERMQSRTEEWYGSSAAYVI